MKKMLLTAALTAVAMTAGAAVPAMQQPSFNKVSHGVALRNAAGAAPARAAESTVSALLGYASDPYTCIGFEPSEAAMQGAAITITSDFIKEYAGCTITAIGVCNGATESTILKSYPITAFVSETLDGTPSQTVSAKMDLTNAGSYFDVPLTEPITLTEGMAPFNVGFTCATKTNVYPIVIDYENKVSGYGCWLGTAASADDDLTWEDEAATYGFVCLMVRLTGDNLPMNKGQLSAYYCPTTVYAGEQQTVQVQVKSYSAAMNSVGIEYSFDNSDDAQLVTIDLPSAISYGESTVVSFPVTFPEAKPNANLSLALTQVDGKENEYASGKQSIYVTALDPQGEYYTKNVLVEESTGTWCGYCPRGYNAMEDMRNAYTDGSCVLVAVHTGDAMTASSYSSYATKFCGGSAPSGTINRNLDEYGTLSFTNNDLENYYKLEREVPATAEIEITDVTVNGAKVSVTSRTRMAFSGKYTYRVSYAIVEDSVGPYAQTNYYAGGSLGALPGWSDAASSVKVTFNDVARFNTSVTGIANSLPTSDIVAGERNEYTKSFSCTTVKKKENARVVAMVINNLTSRIENVTEAPLLASSAINTVAVDNNGTEGVTYYNIQGMPVANPRTGQVLIRRSAEGTQKIVY